MSDAALALKRTVAFNFLNAASRGADEAGGLVVGVLPTDDASHASESVHIPIVTGMGSARNNINILSSDAVIACGMGPGTASEVALAIKGGKKVILLNDMEESKIFFTSLSGGNVYMVNSPDEAVDIVSQVI